MKVVFIEQDQTIEDLLPGVGVVEAGKNFKEFTDDVIEHNQNPYCTALAIPADLDWYIDPDPEFGDYRYPTIEEHRAFLRFQLCLWIYHDKEYTKPIVLNDVTTYNELRLLSAIPNIETVYIPETKLEFSYDAKFELFTAAHDQDSLKNLFYEMKLEGSFFSWEDQ